MSKDSDGEHGMTAALATDLMQKFGQDMENWYDRLHENIVMEFPFGHTVGMPSRVEGKPSCSALFGTVHNAKITFSDVQVISAADPSTVVVQYKGYAGEQNRNYNQTYICIQRYCDGKLSFFREYFDTAVVLNAFGDLSDLNSEDA